MQRTNDQKDIDIAQEKITQYQHKQLHFATGHGGASRVLQNCKTRATWKLAGEGRGKMR